MRYSSETKKATQTLLTSSTLYENDDDTIENMHDLDDSGWDQDKYLVGQHDEQQ